MDYPLIVANWKMNGNLISNKHFFDGLKKNVDQIINEVVLCVPFTYLFQAQSILGDSKIILGAQDISENNDGAFTGQISGNMLEEFGCKYVIIGHSERRNFQNETNELIAEKTRLALDKRIKPIICIGESLSERKNNSTYDVLTKQLEPIISILEKKDLNSIVIAYEPIWAIGTGKNADPILVQKTHNFIRSIFSKIDHIQASKIRILYGGSINSKNANQIFKMKDINGGLVGSASLNLNSFISISKSI
tara:strand:- start:835 stop:1581 length:747 start_codon:yes stop_codon:yes gene_type:complete